LLDKQSAAELAIRTALNVDRRCAARQVGHPHAPYRARFLNFQQISGDDHPLGIEWQCQEHIVPNPLQVWAQHMVQVAANEFDINPNETVIAALADSHRLRCK
jgi:hypothetical protein